MRDHAEVLRELAFEYWFWEIKMQKLPKKQRGSWHGDRWESHLEAALDEAGLDSRAIYVEAERAAIQYVAAHK